MKKAFQYITQLKLLVGVAVSGLVVVSAGAAAPPPPGPAPSCSVMYTDIRGVVTYNGVPTPGVVIEPMCCDSCTIIPCANADPHSAAVNLDTSGEGCQSSPFPTNYIVSFNSVADGGFCQPGCSSVPGVNYGGYCPTRIFLRFSYNGCTNIVSCDQIAALYATCGQVVLNVDINPANCQAPLPLSCFAPGLQIFKTADKTVAQAGQPVTYSYVVTNTGSLAISNIVVVDDNGTPGFTNDDVIVGKTALLAPGDSRTFTATFSIGDPSVQEMCETLNGTNTQVGTLQTTVLPSGDIQVIYTQQNVNDNRYGTGATAATGWAGGHKFNDLVGSDECEFRFTDGGGSVVLDFKEDCISAASSATFPSGTVSYPSGYGTLGATGGDGKMLIGSSANVLFATTSISDNLRLPQFQSGFLVNSPPETSPNSGISTPAGWNYANSYTVVVSSNAFGANGFGGVVIAGVHNSPPKFGKTDLLTPTNCNACVVNVAVATGSVAGTTITASATAQVCLGSPPGCGVLGACTPPYPFKSANPLTSIAFSESEVLRTNRVSVLTGCIPNQIQVFYNDEHALTLGIRQVSVKTKAGTANTTYTVTPLGSDPGSALNPQVGSTIASGDQSGSDVSGRPIYPSLFITDLTTSSDPLAGDWQNGGTAYPPNAVFGTWKAAVKTVDNTKTPSVVTVTPDADPAKNNWNLGAGADSVPAGLANEGYGAEARWDITTLPLVSGHMYRLYFMVHDGDQNKAGGDAGQACATISIP